MSRFHRLRDPGEPPGPHHRLDPPGLCSDRLPPPHHPIIEQPIRARRPALAAWRAGRAWESSSIGEQSGAAHRFYKPD